MLICEHARVDGRAVKCVKINDFCPYGKFCSLTRKCSQWDEAKDCKLRFEDGKNDKTDKVD